MNERTEGEPVPKRGRHVRDGNIPVAIALDLTPLLKRFYGCHPAPVASSVALSASNREANKRTRTAWSLAVQSPLKCDQRTNRPHPSTRNQNSQRSLLLGRVFSNDCAETRTELDTWGSLQPLTMMTRWRGGTDRTGVEQYRSFWTTTTKCVVVCVCACVWLLKLQF